jgi:hypothetical protein
VLGTQQPFARGQVLLEQRDRLSHPADVAVGDSEVVPAAQGPAVVGAKQPLSGGQDVLD